MKLHDLHVLMSVVQAGSMGKAASLLNTTQSAISRSSCFILISFPFVVTRNSLPLVS